ncbi:hypothetical protein CH330_03430 [candidate division WOR-3 bacterium JGI_Cruoil_03_51_56]|uniref:Nitroreductase domain-containing protein n=1 Tax=candidate division WOR-3 bacterium JGI_Cruoil_03_51_56 TaxID=1973747 RepID=A0A235BVG3_UNCW3|nr:MAG: hypothetical protein CH330_03430 [candidate division WOR-3 bacterium JGI_Cruoil_03_51_56]
MSVESEFLNLCRKRCSVRRFSDRPVEKEKLELCLEAARLAPSAENGQPWRFIVFDDPEKKMALARAVFTGIYSASRHFSKAPVLVALLVKESLIINKLGGGIQGTPFQIIDAGIAGEHFILAATEQGLGTCWIGWFNGRGLLKHLGLKRKAYRTIALFAVGYPKPNFQPKEHRRHHIKDIVFWNSLPR